MQVETGFDNSMGNHPNYVDMEIEICVCSEEYDIQPKSARRIGMVLEYK